MSTPTTPSLVSPAVVTVYAAGLMQGLTLVSFPALSSVLTQGLGFTSAEYGAIFLPQVALTVVGAKRHGGRKVIIAPEGSDAWAPEKPRPDETLTRALARAHR